MKSNELKEKDLTDDNDNKFLKGIISKEVDLKTSISTNQSEEPEQELDVFG
jgi:hypothetical protein